MILELIYGGAGAAFRRALCRVLGCRDTVTAGYLICLRCDWFSKFGWRGR